MLLLLYDNELSKHLFLKGISLFFSVTNTLKLFSDLSVCLFVRLFGSLLAFLLSKDNLFARNRNFGIATFAKQAHYLTDLIQIPTHSCLLFLSDWVPVHPGSIDTLLSFHFNSQEKYFCCT